jgi:hypothetical protein
VSETAMPRVSRVRSETPARLPREAREGLMRAWLAILQERHPQLTWVPCRPESEAAAHPGDDQAPAAEQAA